MLVLPSRRPRPIGLICDLVPSSRSQHGIPGVSIRIAESTLSPPVASILRDTQAEPLCELQVLAAQAEAWLSSGAPLVSALPHARGMDVAFLAYVRGDDYDAFIIGSALLERVLNDIVNGGKTSGGGALLKDLIVHPEIDRRLGATSCAALATLFSPKWLNLRNLAWHGFLVPTELQRCYVALVLKLLLQSAEVLRDVRSRERSALPTTYWSLSEADEVLTDALPVLIGEPSFPPPPADGSCTVCLLSPFCRVGLSGPLRRALAAYARRDDATFAVLAFPVLEAGLRAMFVAANPGEAALGLAHFDEYFSTLDGYGQRTKHQLLLSRRLHSNGRPNRLVPALGGGLHALLLDLVMHAAGPSLRAKYAHGEAALFSTAVETLSSSAGAEVAAEGTEEVEAGAVVTREAGIAKGEGVPSAIQLLYAAIVTLCVTAHTQESRCLLTLTLTLIHDPGA